MTQKPEVGDRVALGGVVTHKHEGDRVTVRVDGFGPVTLDDEYTVVTEKAKRTKRKAFDKPD